MAASPGHRVNVQTKQFRELAIAAVYQFERFQTGVQPLTALELNAPEQAAQCVQALQGLLKWYCLRWRIEDWHKVLKSGCRAEDAAHRTAERLTRTIAIDPVVAWRLLLLTLLGREVREFPAELLFTKLELQALQRYAAKKNRAARLSRRRGETDRNPRRLPRPRP